MSTRLSEAVRTSRVSSLSGSASRRKPNGKSEPRVPRRVKTSRARLDYVLEEQVGFQLRLAMQRHTAIFVAKMVLTQTQFATIIKLNQVGPCSQNHLARLVALDAATINGVLDRLRKRGYISTRPDLKDARQRVISITEPGRRLVEQTIKTAKQITTETLSPLTAAERAQLARLLRKLA